MLLRNQRRYDATSEARPVLFSRRTYQRPSAYRAQDRPNIQWVLPGSYDHDGNRQCRPTRVFEPLVPTQIEVHISTTVVVTKALIVATFGKLERP